MGKPRWIVWHTAAHGNAAGDSDTTAKEIDGWHKTRGFRCIGYHYVVRKDGTIELGRFLDSDDDLEGNEVGAHVLGLNSRSIGICFSGHGDFFAHTPAQRAAGLALTLALMKQFGISALKVIGHREVNDLVAAGELSGEYRTSKTCPGLKVDMAEVRAALSGMLGG